MHDSFYLYPLSIFRPGKDVLDSDSRRNRRKAGLAEHMYLSPRDDRCVASTGADPCYIDELAGYKRYGWNDRKRHIDASGFVEYEEQRLGLIFCNFVVGNDCPQVDRVVTIRFGDREVVRRSTSSEHRERWRIGKSIRDPRLPEASKREKHNETVTNSRAQTSRILMSVFRRIWLGMRRHSLSTVFIGGRDVFFIADLVAGGLFRSVPRRFAEVVVARGEKAGCDPAYAMRPHRWVPG